VQKQPIDEVTRTVTTADIKQSVVAVVRDLADDGEGELEQKP
jgi:hypothetical protein